MKFIHKPTPRLDDKREIVLFLWIPLRIKNETRWLEKVTISQVYKRTRVATKLGPMLWDDWINVCFVDKEKI